ncbi:MAG TPA: hypothetical protein PKN95_03135 [Verrucomicrobiota bacterium]|nr:hypothetical protein [Verrucomicrobiota bacterium]HNT13306.1 hypothetical protein [Verrucomicrobiota bacterium]
MKFLNGDSIKVIHVNVRRALLCAALWLGLPDGANVSVQACAPGFTLDLLSDGDWPLLAAPDANFWNELQALNLPLGKFEFLPPSDWDYGGQKLEAEVADLTTALRKAKVPDGEAILTVVAYRKQRAQLNDYAAAVKSWKQNLAGETFYRSTPSTTPADLPMLPALSPIPGLPAEFADYFAGALAWQLLTPDTNTARQAWQRVLARPAAERKFKSTWAAYMLGRSWEAENPEQAITFYRQTRELAQRGFADSTGLAAASLGREALVELRRRHYAAALALYLDQYANGEFSGGESLRRAARAAFNDPEADLIELAKSPRLRPVMTAYVISSTKTWEDPFFSPDPHAAHDLPATARRWLRAIEAVRITEVRDAERLALAAYQIGEYALAAGWAKRAGRSNVGQWLQAKLLLREGQVAAAAQILARLSHQLSPCPPGESDHTDLLDSLTLANHSGRAQLHGDWGTLALTRGDYTEALDTLLRAGFWEDAAYVAERVLTTDELKTYVDQNWPDPRPLTPETTPVAAAASPRYFEKTDPIHNAGQLRYLLARRMARESRGREAEPYFPAAWRPNLQALLAALDGAENPTSPATVRARYFYTAAWIARTNGIELLGTELAPDWFINEGQLDSGLTWQVRATNNLTASINVASEDELNRAAQHRTDPDRRFHYRYQAALLAWEAASLLPDNTDETARILCVAGSWLKIRDPATADLFYKALVRRCRQTAIGAQADAMRWFPVLDAEGNPKPYVRRGRTPDEEFAPSEAPWPAAEEWEPMEEPVNH